MKRLLYLCTAIFLLLFAFNVYAAPITWTDWTSVTTGTSGSAAGSIAGVNVSYTGDVTFGQTGTGTNYWIEYDPPPYTGSSVVDNAPTPAEMVALSNSGITNTITFSESVYMPIMAIVSLGTPSKNVSYDFDTSFSLLSEGRGFWGIDADGVVISTGDILTGNEFHGVIQFEGWVDSISWTATPNEYWHGITFGIAETTSVPDASIMLLLGPAILGLAGFGRKKFKK